MATQKVTLFFTDGGEQGWSESYYKDAASSAVIEEPVGDFGNSPLSHLQGMRRRTMGRSFKLLYARISNEEIRNDARFHAFDVGLQPGLCALPGKAAADDEQVFDAVNVRLSNAGGTTRRSFLLRGLPGGAITQDRSVSANYLAILNNNLRSELVQGGWSIKQTTLAAGVAIQNITIRPDGRSLLIVPALGVEGAAAGLTINVKGISSLMAYADGKWRIDRMDGINIITKPRLRRVIGTYPAAGPGVVQLATAALAPIATVQFLKATRKDTGRPSYVPRGRRSVRRN